MEINSDGLLKKKFHVHNPDNKQDIRKSTDSDNKRDIRDTNSDKRQDIDIRESTNSDNKQDIRESTNSDNKQKIRERKKPINQQQSPLPNNNHNVRKTDFFYEFFSQALNAKGLIGAFVLIIAAIWIAFPTGVPEAPDSPIFQRFGTITTNIFKEIHEVNLPGANAIMEHTVSCRQAANIIQHSVAFESHGSQIATGLRDFGQKIMIAGRTLRKMYTKGSSVYQSFDVEIEAMINRLNSGHARSGDSRYFKNKLNFLLTKIKEFREIVASTLMDITNAEEVRHGLEGYIVDGSREAEKFVGSHGKHRVDIEKAKNELAVVNMVLGHLHESAGHLDRMVKILSAYEDKLMDLSADLGEAGNDHGEDDNDYGLFVLTKKDLKFLRGSVKNLRLYHDSFNRRAQISN